MKKLVFLFLILCSVPSFAQTADDFFAEGKKALSQNTYAEAEGMLKNAAELGHSRSCGYLALFYANSAFPNGRNIDEAFMWAMKGFDRGDFLSTSVLGELEYYNNWKFKNEEAIELLEICYKFKPTLRVANILSAWYQYLGNKKKSMEWLCKAQSIDDNEQNRYTLLETNALIAKQAMDEGKYEVAISLSIDGANSGNPLALYVIGKSLILGRNEKTGKDYVKKAANYEYIPLMDLISFKPEILNYWNEIKDKVYE